MKKFIKLLFVILIIFANKIDSNSQCTIPANNTGVDLQAVAIDILDENPGAGATGTTDPNALRVTELTTIYASVRSNVVSTFPSAYIPITDARLSITIPTNVNFVIGVDGKPIINDPCGIFVVHFFSSADPFTMILQNNGGNFISGTDCNITFQVVGVIGAAGTPENLLLNNSLSTSPCGDQVDNNRATGTIYTRLSKLPISLLDFEGKKINETTQLIWNYIIHENFSHFEIEKSNDGKHFNKFEKVISDFSSFRSVKMSHKIYDYSPFPIINYYRLKIVELNGSFKYSKIIKLRFDQKFSIQAFPNPFTDYITLQGLGKTDSRIEIINHFGQLVKVLQVSGNQLEIQMKDLIPGIYQLRISKEDYYSETIKIVRL